MHSPPEWTAKDLLLHMADEANTIIGTESVKSSGRVARPTAQGIPGTDTPKW